MFNFFFFMIRSPPWSTRTSTLFPYPTRFRSQAVVDRRPALGIIGGGQYARRLVEDEQPCGRRRLHRLVIDRYAFQRIEKRGRCFHRLAVDCDPAVAAHPFDLAASCSSGTRKKLCTAPGLGMAGAGAATGCVSTWDALRRPHPRSQHFVSKGGLYISTPEVF